MENSLRIGHANAQSLTAHFFDIKAIVTSKKLHAFAISESWLAPEVNSNSVRIPGYNLARGDRVGKTRGGVALYVHESINYKIVATSFHTGPYRKSSEYLFVLLHLGSCKLLIDVIYNPDKSYSWSEVEKALLYCNQAYDFLILLGDFNINWQVPSTPRKILRNILNTINVEALAFQPTHHDGAEDSTIDYICVSDKNQVLSFNQEHHPSISKHDVLLATMSLSAPTYTPVTVLRRSLRNLSSADFHNDLSSIEWSRLSDFHDVDDKVDFFTSNILDLFNKHAPLQPVTIRRKTAPWFTSNLKTLIKKRNRAWLRYRRTKNPEDLASYKHLRNCTKSAVRNAASSYFRNKLHNTNNSSDMWKIIDAMGLGNNRKAEAPLPASVDCMNIHFAGLSNPTPLADLRPTARISSDNQFFFEHITISDFFEALSSARSNAQGSDNIPLSFIKQCMPIIMPALLNIFDCSLQSGVFPSAWKSAIVRPLPKRYPALEIGHFRPISILCAASKLLESIAHRQMSKFIEGNDLLDSRQSGFRKKHSTHTALISIVDDFREAADKEKITLAVAIDYTLAFDMLNIDLLVDKLRNSGLSDSACKWVRSFLSNRSQVVKAPSGEISKPIMKNSGVPQGSLNGPPFFSLYINDAPASLKHCSHHIYADDLTIYYSGNFNDADIIVAKVNEDLNALSSWSTSNGLSINPNKTQAMWVGTRPFINRLQTQPPPQLSLNGQSITYCDSLKILGVSIDSTLSWTKHCQETSRKCFAALSKLRKHNDSLPRNTKLLLAKSLVFPHLEYCAGLFLDLTVELNIKLRRCKNAALRFATGLRKYDHITSTYVDHEILSFSSRRNYVCLCLLANVLRFSSPRYLREKFAFRPGDKFGSRRCSELDLVIQHARLECYKQSFTIGVARLWNELPDSIRKYYREPRFKPLLLKYFLTRESK